MRSGKKKRGYWGIGVYNIKTETNLGILWRSAYNFGASFIFTIGKRYKKQPSDTTKAYKHIPLYEYPTFEDFYKHIPKHCSLVCVEQTDNAKSLKDFKHPERAIYLLGAEDYGLPEKITEITDKTGSDYWGYQYVLGDYKIKPIEEEPGEIIDIDGKKFSKATIKEALKMYLMED